MAAEKDVSMSTAWERSCLLIALRRMAPQIRLVVNFEPLIAMAGANSEVVEVA